MVTYFPLIYPDEILFSVLARYHTHTGNMYIFNTLIDLYGEHYPKRINIELPKGIKDLLSQIPADFAFDYNSIIQNNTLFNYYAPFISVRKQMDLFEFMERLNKNSNFFHTSKRYLMPKGNLSYCPLCAEEDWEKYGESYFHRLHQVPCVFVCPKHKCYFNEFLAPISDKNKMQIYNCDYTIINKRPVYELNNTLLNELLRISNSVQYLLEKRNIIVSSDSLYQKYLVLLRQNGYFNSKGYLDKSILCENIKKYYSSHVLNKYNAFPEINDNTNWVNLITIKNNKRIDPIYHILLIQFLTQDFKDFFCNYENINYDKEKEYKNKRYKLREILINHIKQNPSDSRTDIRKKIHNVYDWIRLNDSEWFEVNIVESKKAIIKNELTEEAKRRLSEFIKNNQNCTRALISANLKADYLRCRSYARDWCDENLPETNFDYSLVEKRKEEYRQQFLTYISTHTGCNRTQVYESLSKQYQWLYRFDFNWFNNVLPKVKKVRSALKKDMQNKYRNNFLHFVKDNPKLKREEINSLLKKEYAWFQRYDLDWYKANSPQKQHGRLKKQYIWTTIDTMLLERLEKEYSKIISTGKYKRLTKTYLLRDLQPQLTYFATKYLENLPKLRNYIINITETSEDYHLRKALTLCRNLLEAGVPVFPKKIAYSACVEKENFEKVLEKINRMVEDFQKHKENF